MCFASGITLSRPDLWLHPFAITYFAAAGTSGWPRMGMREQAWAWAQLLLSFHNPPYSAGNAVDRRQRAESWSKTSLVDSVMAGEVVARFQAPINIMCNQCKPKTRPSRWWAAARTASQGYWCSLEWEGTGRASWQDSAPLPAVSSAAGPASRSQRLAGQMRYQVPGAVAGAPPPRPPPRAWPCGRPPLRQPGPLPARD